MSPSRYTMKLRRQLIMARPPAMKIAGMLTIIWTSPVSVSAKCSRMSPRAGATAAPAMTVRSESDNIAHMSFHLLCFLNMLYMNDSFPVQKEKAQVRLDLRFRYATTGF